MIDSQRAQEIFGTTEAMAVSWEGAGGARASKFNRLPFLEIRGITDSADHQAMTQFSANLKIAMENVAQCLVALAR